MVGEIVRKYLSMYTINLIEYNCAVFFLIINNVTLQTLEIASSIEYLEIKSAFDSIGKYFRDDSNSTGGGANGHHCNETLEVKNELI
jgi:hypothetical protein